MKKINLIILSAGVSAFILSGCAIVDPMKVSTYEDQDFKMFSNSAAVSNTAVRNVADNKIICAGLSPDAALSEQADTALSISMLNFGEKSNDGIEEGETESSLGGRSANVLITREILYRQCELFGNSNFTDEEKREIFENTLQSLVNINSTDLGAGTAAKDVDSQPASIMQPVSDSTVIGKPETDNSDTDYDDDPY